MARRGFFAEIQHQMAVAERERQRTQTQNMRELERRRREAARLAAASQRAQEKAAREATRMEAAVQREAKRAYEESRQAEAESMDAEIQVRLDDIDAILQATLDVDDFVDLEALRAAAEHPPFESPNLHPHMAPAPSPPPGPEPVFSPLPASGGMFSRKREERQAQLARRAFDHAHANWLTEVDAHVRWQHETTEHQRVESERLRALEREKADYQAACRAREIDAQAHNRELDALIAGFAAGDQDAVEEYFSIVLRNSVYPDGIELGVEYDVDTRTREMTLYIDLPRPDEVPSAKGYKWVRARDEIAPVAQTQKEQRDRYARLVANIVVRTIHEICESDRAGHIATIALSAGVTHTDPGTGHDTRTLLVQVAVERKEFDALNLTRVDAIESLAHLGAVVSKNPWSLTPIPDASGVRHR